MNKVALVLQGPWHTQWLAQLDHYQEVFDEIVVSTYFCEQLIEWLGKDSMSRIKFIINDMWIPQGYDNSGNIFYQAKTTLAGIHAVQSPLVVKARLDESYSNMWLPKNLLIANPDRFVSLNLFFRKNTHISYHMSDHLFGGRTQWIRDGFVDVINMCSVPKPELCNLLYPGFYHAEVMITWNLLHRAGVNMFEGHAEDHMCKHIQIVPIQYMKPFVFLGAIPKPWTTIEQCRGTKDDPNPLYQTIREYMQ